ncbi:MAG: glucose-1-phosphate cytidylyltransferase [Flavobacteriaceae bacterium]
MKVVLLAGGLGTRLAEYTSVIPKPMVPIGGRPILWHIMNTYSKYGHKEFYLALGHKSEVIKEYFLNYYDLNSDFTVDLKTGKTKHHQKNFLDWKVTLVNTGKVTMTGGRVKRLKEFIGDDPFFLTYGDGVSDIDIDELLKFHKEHNKMVTMTAVRPPARFGELELNEKGIVKSFKEKPQMHKGWINGGFFVVEPKFIDFINGDETLLEREPLEKAAEIDELMAFRHEGFWQCMDTMRDKELLEKLWSKGNAPWQ